jgi:hypothetical protein
MPRAPLTRRHFLALTGATISARALPAQTISARIDVASVERPRILAAAPAALSAPIAPLTSTPSPHGSLNDFFSEITFERSIIDPHSAPHLFRAHAIALRNASNTIACLSAAYLLTHDEHYAQRAGAHLGAWFLAPQTRMNPNASLAGCAPKSADSSSTGTPAGVVDIAPLAELVRSTSFLIDSTALSPAEFATLNAWFTAFASWLDTDRNARIARDTKDHRASAWLIVRSAIARNARNDSDLEDCRRRFRHPTLRNQINENGVFTQEVATANPFRNTLFNFDLLAGACQLLASPFDPLWDFELEDGPGMRSAVAYLYPFINDPEKWPYVSDADHFRELPGPCSALLFAGRAYDRPEYVELWRTLDAKPVPEDIAASFPIRQPLLWSERALHGL